MPRILIVDDDCVALEHAVLCLRRAGYAVETASNGEQGLALASTHPFDLVLSDVYMPVLGGFGMADRLREEAGPFAPPIIFMSAIQDQANYRRAFGMRAADFLIKPIACAEFLRTVGERLGTERSSMRLESVQIAGYRIQKPLGNGSSASVHLATRESTLETCALKIIRLPENWDEQAQTVERFRREYSILESIDHPGIVKVLEHGVADEALYIAMEYFPGGDLTRDLHQPRHPAIAIGECLQVANALGFIHERGVVHRDLKPSNVMRRSDSTLALVDFGIARRGDHHLTVHGQVMGTPSFMSPEQFDHERVDARSDIYSLGCLLYQMLTGTLAFQADTLPALYAAHAVGPRPRLPEKLAIYQDALDRMLARNRNDRFPDGNAAVHALDILRGMHASRAHRSSALSNLDLEI